MGQRFSTQTVGHELVPVGNPGNELLGEVPAEIAFVELSGGLAEGCAGKVPNEAAGNNVVLVACMADAKPAGQGGIGELKPREPFVRGYRDPSALAPRDAPAPYHVGLQHVEVVLPQSLPEYREHPGVAEVAKSLGVRRVVVQLERARERGGF